MTTNSESIDLLKENLESLNITINNSSHNPKDSHNPKERNESEEPENFYLKEDKRIRFADKLIVFRSFIINKMYLSEKKPGTTYYKEARGIILGLLKNAGESSSFSAEQQIFFKELANSLIVKKDFPELAETLGNAIQSLYKKTEYINGNLKKYSDDAYLLILLKDFVSYFIKLPDPQVQEDNLIKLKEEYVSEIEKIFGKTFDKPEESTSHEDLFLEPKFSSSSLIKINNASSLTDLKEKITTFYIKVLHTPSIPSKLLKAQKVTLDFSKKIELEMELSDSKEDKKEFYRNSKNAISKDSNNSTEIEIQRLEPHHSKQAPNKEKIKQDIITQLLNLVEYLNDRNKKTCPNIFGFLFNYYTIDDYNNKFDRVSSILKDLSNLDNLNFKVPSARFNKYLLNLKELLKNVPSETRREIQQKIQQDPTYKYLKTMLDLHANLRIELKGIVKERNNKDTNQQKHYLSDIKKICSTEIKKPPNLEQKTLWPSFNDLVSHEIKNTKGLSSKEAEEIKAHLNLEEERTTQNSLQA